MAELKNVREWNTYSRMKLFANRFVFLQNGEEKGVLYDTVLGEVILDGLKDAALLFKPNIKEEPWFYVEIAPENELPEASHRMILDARGKKLWLGDDALQLMEKCGNRYWKKEREIRSLADSLSLNKNSENQKKLNALKQELDDNWYNPWGLSLNKIVEKYSIDHGPVYPYYPLSPKDGKQQGNIDTRGIFSDHMREAKKRQHFGDIAGASLCLSELKFVPEGLRCKTQTSEVFCLELNQGRKKIVLPIFNIENSDINRTNMNQDDIAAFENHVKINPEDAPFLPIGFYENDECFEILKATGNRKIRNLINTRLSDASKVGRIDLKSSKELGNKQIKEDKASSLNK